MIAIGEYNLLIAARRTPQGIYMMDDRDGEEVLLPNAYVPDDIQLDDELDLFVYHDSEGRPIATTLEPKIKLDSFAFLMAKSITSAGTFMDWGLAKDLLVPPALTYKPMTVGKPYLVYMFRDKVSGRLVGTTKVKDYLNQDKLTVREGDEVDLLVFDTTDIGFKVVINEMHEGLIYRNEVYQPVRIGDKLKGFVRKIREENKIDIRLQRSGLKNIDSSATKVLERLKANGGILRLNDLSDPDDIKAELQMSKKTFKKAIGSLYKNRIIRIEGDGIHLTKKAKE